MRLCPMKMKIKVMLGLFSLLLQAGCYVRTQLHVQDRQIPSGFLGPALVLTVGDNIGLDEEKLDNLEQDVLRALVATGIKCTTLKKAIGEGDTSNAAKLLKSENYRGLLKVVVTFWGSKTATLPAQPPPSVASIDPDRGSSFFQPGSIEESPQPGPTTTYKEVAMTGSLLDLRSNRLVWSCKLKASPAIVGRSYLYHRFNRALKLEDLAQRCVRKLAAALARVWPKKSAA